MLRLPLNVAHFWDPSHSRTFRELSALDIFISFFFILSYTTFRGCSSLLLHKEALVKDSENPFFGKSSGQFLVLLRLDQPGALNKLLSPFLRRLFHLAFHTPSLLIFSYLVDSSCSVFFTAVSLFWKGTVEMFHLVSSGNKEGAATIGDLKTIKLKESHELKYYFYHALTILNNVNDKILLPAGKKTAHSVLCFDMSLCRSVSRFNQGPSFSSDLIQSHLKDLHRQLYVDLSLPSPLLPSSPTPICLLDTFTWISN